jgi:peptide/nickel transport system substrate-binding protein
VNIAKALSPQQLSTLESNDAVTVKKCKSAIRDYMGLNASDPILSNQKVRQAISLALDREAITKAVYLDEYGSPAVSGVSAVYEATDGKDFYEHDLKRAKQLMSEAGYADGFPLKLSITPSNPGDYVQSLAVLIQDQLKEIGIDVTIDTIASNPTFTQMGSEHQFQAYIWNETPAVGNPGLGANITFGCTASQNYGGFCDEAIDAQAKTTLAHTAATPEYEADVNKLSAMIDQAQPAIYIEDVVKAEPISTCAAMVPQSFQVDWSPLSEPVIEC